MVCDVALADFFSDVAPVCLIIASIVPLITVYRLTVASLVDCEGAKSQVDAFTCFGRILNLLEELLLPDRIVECRNCLGSTGQISAQRHIQVAEFRYACL
jgi:hypothetical protein